MYIHVRACLLYVDMVYIMLNFIEVYIPHVAVVTTGGIYLLW